MVRYRRSALLRAFAILFLLWVGADFGAHGFCPFDLEPIAGGDTAAHLDLDAGAQPSALAPDHCFSHGTFLGSVPTLGLAGLIPTGAATLRTVPAAPDTNPHPLDKPPQARS